MIENKVFKKEMIKNIKMNTNNIMMKFKKLPNFNSTHESFECNEEDFKDLIIKEKDNFYYEWLNHKTKIKPYYDFDLHFTNKEEWEKGKITILDEAIKKITELYPNGELAICQAHGRKIKEHMEKGKKIKTKGWAVSYHIVINNYETTIKKLKIFNEKNHFKELEGYDKNPYLDGQNFRLIYSYKGGDKRQKIPHNFKTEACIPLHIIQSNKLTQPNYNSVKDLPNSPPVSPPSSDNEINNDDDEVIDFVPPIIPKKSVDLQELEEILNNIEELADEYSDWIDVGRAIHNIRNGDKIGLGLWTEWSMNYDGFKNNTTKRNCPKNWKYWTDKRKEEDEEGIKKNRYGYTFLKDWNEKLKPLDKESTLEEIFISGIDKEHPEKTANAKIKMMKYMNEKLIFIKETGDFIILDKKLHRKEDESVIEVPCWYLHTTAKVITHYKKENFVYHFEIEINGEMKKYKEKINPFNNWIEWIDRHEVRAIGFDPRDNSTSDIFNLWNGFAISKEMADEYDEEDAEPILEHIKELWCNNNENTFNYVLDLFSHYIQKPHIKTCVLLALKSKQGGGKGIILDKLAKIIGDDHYIQNSNADYLFGNFNGQLEAKVVCNLDEAFWGGDKKKEGEVKNKITESRQTINKKNKEAYKIDDYVNYIITTNNDWFAGISEDDRRFYCLELNNKLSGRMTDKTYKEVQPVLDAPCEAFAKILYNRDISNFKPRIFQKTPLLQEQVERGWNSVKTWYNSVMKDGGFTYNKNGEQYFVEWNKLLMINDYENCNKKYGGEYLQLKNKNKKIKTAYEKDFIYECYNQNGGEKYFKKESFYRELKKNCIHEDNKLLKEQKIQIKGIRKPYLFFPDLDIAREEWDNNQEYNYEYHIQDEDEWEVVDDCLLNDSDDE